MDLDILCKSITDSNVTIDHSILISLREARPDLIIEQIIEEKGAEYVLNAIGDKAINEYLNNQAKAA